MATFTTRVELHKAAEKDYECLHGAMEAEGFSRTITTSSGKEYHLPTAEYSFKGEATTDEVLDAAKRAVKTTGKTSSILVTESRSRRFSGLVEVAKPEAPEETLARTVLVFKKSR